MIKLRASLVLKIVFGLIIVFVFSLFLRLGRDYLFDWDEGIYAELGREIIQFKNLLTPSWNQHLWLEKPPGIAWTTALGMKFFGVGEFGARFFMPLFAGLTLIFVFLIGKTLSDVYSGWLATLLLANMDLFLSRARAVNTDGALLAGITATVYLLLTNASPWLVALTISFSVLFKGLAGFLSLLISLPLLIKKPKKYLLLLTSYLLLFILPWHIYQLIVNGNKFLTPYFKEQVLRRTTVPIEFHLESRWYYFHYLYQNLGLGWLFLLIAGVILITFRIISSHQKSNSSLITETRLLITIIWWFLFPLALFTLAKTRLFWYILPIYPAIALIIAYFLRSLATQKLSQQILLLFLGLYSLFTFNHLLQNVEYRRTRAQLSPRIKLAQLASHQPQSTLLVLVPKTERVAEAILPQNQRISSSFRYGGAPSLVFYSRKQVIYFYNLDEFKANLKSGTIALLTQSDYQTLQLPSNQILDQAGDYLLIQVK